MGVPDDYRAVVVSRGAKRRAELAAKRVGRALGLDIERAKPPMQDRRRRQLMNRLGVDLVIDVGANDGQYAKRVRGSAYRGLIASFEPLAGVHARLAARAAGDPGWRCFHLAVGDREQTTTIHVSADTYSSSLLKVREELVDVALGTRQIDDEVVRMVTLESMAEELGLDQRTSLLKMDVQGYERQVLDGARSVLGRMPLLELELTVRPMYDGQELYLEMLSMLEELGYRPSVLWEEFVDLATGRLFQFNVIAERVPRDMFAAGDADHPREGPQERPK